MIMIMGPDLISNQPWLTIHEPRRFIMNLSLDNDMPKEYLLNFYEERHLSYKDQGCNEMNIYTHKK